MLSKYFSIYVKITRCECYLKLVCNTNIRHAETRDRALSCAGLQKHTKHAPLLIERLSQTYIYRRKRNIFINILYP